MNFKNLTGLSFSFEGCENFISSNHNPFITQKGKVSEYYRDTVISLENGQKLNGYVKPIYEEGKAIRFELCPNKFKKEIELLIKLGVHSVLIDEEPKTKTKGKFVIVKLSPEQEEELNRYKALCK